MTDLFISYSRRDAEFVQHLHAGFAAIQRDVWIDFEDIPLSADWWDEIRRNIEAADTFIFVISPDSLSSPICHLELDHAISYNKRLVPIIRVMTDEKTMLNALINRNLDDTTQQMMGGRDLLALARANWQALSRHNWLFFNDDSHFDTTFATLLKVVDTDLAYVRHHTRLLVRAREWQDGGKQNPFLLNSGEISEYSAWVREGAAKDPRPTELQLEYLFVSQRAANRRQAITYISMMVALVITGVLIALSYLQNQQITAGEQTRIAIQGQSLAQAATANAQALILTEQRATGEANLLLITAQAATNIARQTAVFEDLGDRLQTAQAGFIFLTQQAQNIATGTAIAGTLDALVASNTEVVATLGFFQQAATLIAEQASTQVFFPPVTTLLPPPTLTPTVTPSPTPSPSPSPSPTLTPIPLITNTGLSEDLNENENTLYVSPNGDDRSDCVTSDTPCQTIGSALLKAPKNALIRVDYGIYDENLMVERPVTLVGAERDLTIITGGQRATTIRIAATGRLDVRNLTITGGSSDEAGGGIRNDGTLVARNIALTGNSSTSVGGGLANFGNAAMINASITNNLAASGGGVYSASQAAYASDSQTIHSNNTATVINNATNDNLVRDTCPVEVVSAAAEATTGICDGQASSTACLIRGTVSTLNGDGSPFATPGDRISLATVAGFQFSTAQAIEERSAVLMNLSVELDQPPTRQVYVRGAVPLPADPWPIRVGAQALTIPGFDTGLNIRTDPTTSANIVMGVYSGLVVSVLDGPVSADGYQWWYLRLPNGAAGWAVESANEEPTLMGLPESRTVRVGATYTIYGAGSRGLNLRTKPSTLAATITTLRQGLDVTILDGPIEANGYRWWYVVSTATNELGWLVDDRTLLPVVTTREYMPEVYLFEDGVCSYSNQNPLRLETTVGTLRLELSNLVIVP